MAKTAKDTENYRNNNQKAFVKMNKKGQCIENSIDACLKEQRKLREHCNDLPNS